LDGPSVSIPVTSFAPPALPLPQVLLSLMAPSAPPESSASLVQQARKGDSSAFGTLVRNAQRAVYGLCYRLLRSDGDANEMAQETFLRAFQNLARYDETKPFEVWVLSIARNLCLDKLRHRSRFPEEAVDALQDALPSHAVTQEQQVIAQQEGRALEAALARLPVEEREVLALYYVQRRTTKEIASVLGVAPGTIMAKLFRSREKLRKILTEEIAP